jgi:N-methylhydantoinase B
VEDCRYLPDSAGAGRWRGGLGTTSSWRFDGRDELGVSIGDDAASEGAEPAHGLFGGEPAGLNDLELHFPDGTVRDWGSKEIVHDIPIGTICVARNGGGGGYGDPHEREAALVLEEVRDGLLSVAKARASYGVAVLDDLSAVDEAETARLRSGP